MINIVIFAGCLIFGISCGTIIDHPNELAQTLAVLSGASVVVSLPWWTPVRLLIESTGLLLS